MEINLDDLEAKCRAATGGQWEIDNTPSVNEGAPHLMTADGYGIADFWGHESSLGLDANKKNAAYVAAICPAVTLELIAQLRAAQNARENLLHLLATALPFVEDHEGSQIYKAGAVAALVKNIKAEIAKVDA